MRRAKFTGQWWFHAGCEILGMGGLVAAVSFLIGWFIEDVVLVSTESLGGLH